MLSIRTIVCPTDFSEPSQEAFKFAVKLASDLGAELVVVHIVFVLPPAYVTLVPDYGRVLQADAEVKLRSLTEQVPQPITVRTIIGHGDTATGIVSIAEKENADLIVIATHGMTGFRHLVFGSVAEKVVRLAKCPVLTTRAHVPWPKKPEEVEATA